MHCVPQDSAEYKKRFFSFFVLLSVFLISGGTGKLYAAAEPGLAFEALYEEQCAVCLESFEAAEPVTSLRCSHRYHTACVRAWLEHSQCAWCPLCKASVV